MFGGERDLTNGMNNTMDESSVSKLTRFSSERNKNNNNPDRKMGIFDKGMGFLRESEMGSSDGFQSRAFSKFGNSGSQELTLSYLCDFNTHSNANNNSSSKQAFLEKEFSGKNLLNSFDKGGGGSSSSHTNYKGKEVVVVSENSIQGTNGSVHSRFQPVGDGVALNNHGGGGGGGLYALMQGKAASESLRGFEGVDGGGRPRKVSRPERIIREIVNESVPLMAQTIQELSDETLLSTKEYLRNLISMVDKKDELENLQNRLKRRSDLTKETLSKCQKDQLEILVAVKFGLGSFLSVKNRLPPVELVEIFLSVRCKNVNCKSLLPVDDCDCKICSENKGFCSSCMCPVCFKFDYASNTCSWVGCDVCSHWCHASCGIQRNLIKPGPSLKGPSGTTEMQFHCICCDHASEMFGFVKDVFLCCAKDWGLENFVKELDCVRKIFRGSDDFKGKELHNKAEEIISKLGNKLMSPTDACGSITQFFKYTDNMSEYSSSVITTKELSSKTQSSVRKETTPIPQSTSLAAKYAPYNMSSSLQRDVISNDVRLSDHKSSIISSDDDFRFGSISKPDGFDSLESIVLVKEAEARMFQSKADEARRDAEEYHRMIRATTEKLEGEHAEALKTVLARDRR
uniref:Protein OBERON 3 n=1 Tax=Cannabis sativa TaxID=3483 RepID=A0A803Q3H4_CANSA